MRVLIGAPLRQDPGIFREYLKAIDGLILPDGVTVDRFFIANGADPACLEMLKPHEYDVRDDLAPTAYTAGEKNHTWTLYDMLKMCELRSILTDAVRDGGYDYLFSIDTDVIVQPETLETLLSRSVPIVTEVFWTRSDSGFEWANAWQADNYGVTVEDFARWKTPGFYPVGMAGACTLIHRSVFEAGVSYRQIPNVQKALIGEDRHFCVRAACAGFSQWLDTTCPARHLYRLSEYQKFMEERNGDDQRTG